MQARESRYKWWLLLLLGGAYFFHQADRAIFGVLLPYVKKDLALTDFQLGHINTVLFLTIAVATFIAGFLGDRFNRKRIITFSLLFWSFATMGLGFASTFAAVILLRSVATGGGELLRSVGDVPPRVPSQGDEVPGVLDSSGGALPRAYAERVPRAVGSWACR